MQRGTVCEVGELCTVSTAGLSQGASSVPCICGTLFLEVMYFVS